ncbi:hypothetical protein FRC19_005249 [Serendipita sp. 401]|nr:hypothetical protein FRC19_005249 [Serendipita sp. 401]
MVAGNTGPNPSTSNNSEAGVATTSTNSPPVQREPEANYVVAWNSTSGNFSGRNLDEHVPYT